MLIVVAVGLLALLPLGLATLTFGRAFRASETAHQDAKLAAALGAANDRLAKAGAAALKSASLLARTLPVQRALRAHDEAALRRFVRRDGPAALAVVPPGKIAVSTGDDVVRTVAIVGAHGTIGRVVARIRLTPSLLAGIEEETGVTLLATHAGRVSSGRFQGLAVSGSGRPFDARFGGKGYRVQAMPKGASPRLIALEPRSSTDGAVLKREALTFGAGALTVAAAMLGLLFVAFNGAGRIRRRDGERNPLALVGDAFAAAHDLHALLPVILETTVDATGAGGGQLIWNREVVARLGSTGRTAGALVLSLDDAQDGSRLILHPSPKPFSAADRDLARSLVTQGRVALENARLSTIVQRQAVTDDLTELPNRRRFMEELRREIARVERDATPLALVLFDIDDFKRINDRCGHGAGDDVLRSTAEVIRARLRRTDMAGRLGGEEFGVLLPGTDARGGAALAEDIRGGLVRDIRVVGLTAPVTASFGVAVYHPGETEAEFLGDADKALYRAKAAGKNQVVVGRRLSSAGAP